MKHLEFDFNGMRYSLCGDCITVFTRTGRKISHRFFPSYSIARAVMLKLYDRVTRISA